MRILRCKTARNKPRLFILFQDISPMTLKACNKILRTIMKIRNGDAWSKEEEVPFDGPLLSVSQYFQKSWLHGNSILKYRRVEFFLRIAFFFCSLPPLSPCQPIKYRKTWNIVQIHTKGWFFLPAFYEPTFLRFLCFWWHFCLLCSQISQFTLIISFTFLAQ